MPYCPICGKDVTDMVKEKGKFPLTDLRDVICEWCEGSIICYKSAGINVEKMTPDEFLETVKKLYPPLDEDGYSQEDFDPEVAHKMYDTLIENTLIEFGYNEGVKYVRNTSNSRWWA